MQHVVVKVFDNELVQKNSSINHDPLSEIHLQEKFSRSYSHLINPVMNHFRSETKEFVVSPFYKNGDLFEFIVKEICLTEQQARKIMHRCCEALLVLHDNRISHRDVSLENFLLDDYALPLLTDFGVSKEMENNFMIENTGPVGKKNYMAPEFSECQRFPFYDGRKIDVF